MDVAPLLLPDEDDGASVEFAEAGDHRAVVSERPVPVELEPVLEEALHIVERVRPLLVSSQLDLAPDLLVGRLLPDPLDLPLQPLELAGEPCTADQREVLQAPEPLAQP